MRGAALVAVWLGLAGAGLAQDLPALHDVVGVAADDRLNVRAGPDGSAPILGALRPDARGIEVTGLSADGRWGQINLGEQSGYVAMRFLAPGAAAPWPTMETGLACLGTEPFWSVAYDPALRTMRLERPAEDAMPLDLVSAVPVSGRSDSLALVLAGPGRTGTAILRAQSCSDGMSDRRFGLDLTLLLTTAEGATAMTGCCSLVAP